MECKFFDPAEFLKTLTQRPGIYRMLDGAGKVLYVGKARNLKNRVASYFRSNLSPKTSALMKLVSDVQVIITDSENAALILESNLIKEFKPRFNVLLRDDKSYPYIFISTEHEFPRIELHRGKINAKGRYFGPFPNSYAVRESLQLLQKLFRIRPCRDSFFRNRTRPCLQYQIDRCTGPCVGLIDKQSYAEDIGLAISFLEGKNEQIIQNLMTRMQQAASEQKYELAAEFRNQIDHLRHVQEQQVVNKTQGDVDIIALIWQSGIACLAILYLRAGRILGNKCFFPKIPQDSDANEVIESFISQYYLQSVHQEDIPRYIILNQEFPELSWLENTLAEVAQHPVKIITKPRGDQTGWVQMAIDNAKQAMTQHLAQQLIIEERLIALQKALDLKALPLTIECFDISHTQGEATVASCVVYSPQGFKKSAYRRFNIKNITAGDDYAAMHQALLRHFKQILQKNSALPDLLLIDGGKGQLAQAKAVLAELNITAITVLAIAKGPSRKPEFETYWLADKEQAISLEQYPAAMHLLQEIRNEAHRFAITGHRKQRAKRRNVSFLEQIPGIGAKRRQQLLQRFGGLQGIKVASVHEIAKCPGLNLALAERIYQFLHKD